jgi:hypothetical protein
VGVDSSGRRARVTLVAVALALLATVPAISGTSTKGVDCTDPKVYTQQASCLIPTYVLSAYVRPGSRDTSDQNLYSLLATTEDVLGYPRLGRAVGQPSLRAGLRF